MNLAIRTNAKPFSSLKLVSRTVAGILLFILGAILFFIGVTDHVKVNNYRNALQVDVRTVIAIARDVEAMGADYDRNVIVEKYSVDARKTSLKSMPPPFRLQLRLWLAAVGAAFIIFSLLIPYVGKHVLNYAVLLVVIFPFFWMALASFKNNVDIIDATKNMFQFTPTMKNFITVFDKYNFIRPMLNSSYVAVLSTGLALVIGLPAAYSVARFKLYKISLCILVVRMIPGITFLVPWFMLFMRLGLTNTFAALILSHMLIALPFIIWIMVPFFENVPGELEEAAWVDGSPQWKGFFTILLPVSTPGILTASLLAFIFSWNNFMFSLTLSGAKTTTLPIAIYGFVGYASVDWGGLMAAATIITLPIIVLSLLMQRHIISGLTAGAVKG